MISKNNPKLYLKSENFLRKCVQKAVRNSTRFWIGFSLENATPKGPSECPWRALGRLWVPLGRLWVLRDATLAPLGGSWASLGFLWGPLGTSWDLSWALMNAQMHPDGSSSPQVGAHVPMCPDTALASRHCFLLFEGM